MNLIMCRTPLQTIIAERIIEMFPNESFEVICYFESRNKKQAYYSTRLKKKVSYIPK